MVAIAVTGAFADTPASQVYTQTVQPTQTYPEVPANGEGWFDVGGFCKVVDLGDLSAMTPPASGVPVFVPGPADQWENYRTSAGTHYNGQLVLTTCCRPQTNITNLCTEAGATPVAVNRQYGKVGEVDTVTDTCVDQWGKQFQDQINVACQVTGGGADGPDAQGQWAESSSDTTSGCTANAYTSPCSASCPTTTGTTTTYTSCGTVQSVNACSISCCTPSYSYACNQSTGDYVRTDNACGTGSAIVGACSYNITTSTKSCGGFNYSDSYDDGACTISYKQCNAGDWGCGVDATCNEGCTTLGCGQNFVAHVTCDGVTSNGGLTCPVYQYSCSRGRYTYP